MTEELIVPYPDDPAVRVAEIRRYLARTIHYNGYYRGFGDTPQHKAAKQLRLRDWALDDDVEHVRVLLDSGLDLVGDLLSRLDGFGVLREGSADERRRWVMQWELVETTINARVSVALALIPPDTLGAVMERLVPQAGSIGPVTVSRVSDLGSDKGKQGYPDLILKGPDSLVLVELKTRGTRSARKYDVGQLLKYLTLARADRDTWSRPDERRVLHVLLRPNGGGSCVHHRSSWFHESVVAGGPVRIDSKAVKELSARAELVDDFDVDAALELLDIMPIYERHYADLEAATAEASLGRWDEIVRSQLRWARERAEPAPREPATASADPSR